MGGGEGKGARGVGAGRGGEAGGGACGGACGGIGGEALVDTINNAAATARMAAERSLMATSGPTPRLAHGVLVRYRYSCTVVP